MLPRHCLQCHLRERVPAGYVDEKVDVDDAGVELIGIGTSLARPVIARAQIEIAKVGFIPPDKR